jgi:hypothetical protein
MNILSNFFYIFLMRLLLVSMVGLFISGQTYSTNKDLTQSENKSFSSDEVVAKLNNIIIKICIKNPRILPLAIVEGVSGVLTIFIMWQRQIKKNNESQRKISDLESEMKSLGEGSEKAQASLLDQKNDYIALKNQYETMKNTHVKQLQNQIKNKN